MPSLGDVFADVRGDNRTMRVSCHVERGIVVVSLWAGAMCRGSFRMAADDVERLISTLGEMRAAVDPEAAVDPVAVVDPEPSVAAEADKPGDSAGNASADMRGRLPRPRVAGEPRVA